MFIRLRFMAALEVVLLVALCPIAGAKDVTHAFDGVGAPPAFKFIFPGFDNGPHLEYPWVTLDGGVILNDAVFGQSATSGDNILASCDACVLDDGSGLPGLITGMFASRVESILLDAINGDSGSPGLFTLTAFDGKGQVVDSDSAFLAPMGVAGFVQPLQATGAGIESFTVTSSLTFTTFAIDTLDFELTEASWVDLGQSLAGTHGDPALSATGTLLEGDPISIRLLNGLENTTATLVVGFTTVNLPFYGGTLVPAFQPPDGFFVPLLTNGSGGVDINDTWPGGVPAGFKLNMQYWVVDSGAPFGLAASNAVSGTVP